MSEHTPTPWEVTYPWDDPKYGPHKTWVVHRTMCDPEDCPNFGDCGKPCYEWQAILAGDLEAAGAPSDDVMAANARYAAAAPDMVKALDHFVFCTQDGCNECYELAAAALAKAKGEG